MGGVTLPRQYGANRDFSGPCRAQLTEAEAIARAVLPAVDGTVAERTRVAERSPSCQRCQARNR